MPCPYKNQTYFTGFNNGLKPIVYIHDSPHSLEISPANPLDSDVT